VLRPADAGHLPVPQIQQMPRRLITATQIIGSNAVPFNGQLAQLGEDRRGTGVVIQVDSRIGPTVYKDDTVDLIPLELLDHAAFQLRILLCVTDQ